MEMLIIKKFPNRIAGHMPPAGRVFETPVLEPHLALKKVICNFNVYLKNNVKSNDFKQFTV